MADVLIVPERKKSNKERRREEKRERARGRAAESRRRHTEGERERRIREKLLPEVLKNLLFLFTWNLYKAV